MSNDSTLLDVEDDEQRQKRIGTLLKRLDNTSPTCTESPNSLLNIGHDRLPGPIEPPTELLERVQAFLPAIATSNEALSRQNPEDINIENIPKDEERYIEMNLGLGVLEAKPCPEPGSHSPPASDADSTSDATSSESGSDSDSSSSGSSSSSEEESSSSSSSSDDSDDSDDSDAESQSDSSINMKPISSRPIKPLPRRVSQNAKLEV